MSAPAAASASAAAAAAPSDASAAPAGAFDPARSHLFFAPLPTKGDPFPHLRVYHTDTHVKSLELDARDAAAGGAQPIREREYSAEELELMEQLRANVAAMMADPAQMVATAEDYPGGMHVHWTTHWPEGKALPMIAEDNVSALDADPARWPLQELYRFLKARDMNLKKATKMYFHYRRWRVIYGASHIASLPTAPLEPLIESILGASYHKWDRHGRPLYIQRSGSIDVARFNREVALNKIAIGHTWFTEEMKKRMEVGSRIVGERVTKLVMIIDIKGMGLSARKLMNIFGTTTYIDQNFMPESMGCMYIVNAPSFFPVIFSLAKAFLSAETQRKIKILGSGPKALSSMVEDLGAECVPVEYGGLCRCEEKQGGCCALPSGVAPISAEDQEGEEETVNVAAGYESTVELPVIASAEEEAFWSLSVASRDVDFSVEFRPAAPLREDGSADGDAPEPAPIDVLPVTRVASGAACTGTYTPRTTGVLHFTISNTYSRWHGKTATIRTGTRQKA